MTTNNSPYKGEGETVDVFDSSDNTPTTTSSDSDSPLYQDGDWLYQQYHLLKKSTTEIANECGVARQTISEWMSIHNIDTRDSSEYLSIAQRKNAPWRKREWLYEQYISRGKSLYRIANEYDTSANILSRWLDIHGIEQRGEKYSPLFYSEREYTDEEWLREQYHEKEKGLSEIADEVGVHQTTILYHMDKYDIERRDMTGLMLDFRAQENSIPINSTDNSPSEGEATVEISHGSRSYTGPEGGIDGTWSDISSRRVGERGCPYRDREWLHKMYWVEKKSSSEMADICGVSRRTVVRWMDKFGIERRSISNSRVVDKDVNPSETYQDEEWLRDQYIAQEKSATDISREYGVGSATIYEWLDKHNIERRDSGSYATSELDVDPGDTYRDAEWLYTQYWDNEKTLSDMADDCGVSCGTIRNWMDKFGIERR